MYSVSSTRRRICLQWYAQQFPCILCIASTRSLLSSCGLYNVHEKSLIEGECELNYKKHSRGQRGKKHLIFLHISTILTQKTCKLCLSLWTFENNITKNFLLSSAISFSVLNKYINIFDVCPWPCKTACGMRSFDIKRSQLIKQIKTHCVKKEQYLESCSFMLDSHWIVISYKYSS